MSGIRVAFAGARGRTGRVLVPGIAAAEGIELVAEIEKGDDLAARARTARAQVVVDFTEPGERPAKCAGHPRRRRRGGDRDDGLHPGGPGRPGARGGRRRAGAARGAELRPRHGPPPTLRGRRRAVAPPGGGRGSPPRRKAGRPVRNGPGHRAPPGPGGSPVRSAGRRALARAGRPGGPGPQSAPPRDRRPPGGPLRGRRARPCCSATTPPVATAIFRASCLAIRAMPGRVGLLRGLDPALPLRPARFPPVGRRPGPDSPCGSSIDFAWSTSSTGRPPGTGIASTSFSAPAGPRSGSAPRT